MSCVSIAVTLIIAVWTISAAARLFKEEPIVDGCTASAASLMWNSDETKLNSVDITSFSNSDKAADVNALSMRNLRGQALSRPCCVSWAPGRVDCFFRGPKSSIMHKAVKKTDECCPCKDWTDLGGTFRSGVECVSRDVNYIDILAVDSHGVVYVKSFSPDGWMPWANKGATFFEEPSCAARDKNTVTCLLRNYLTAGIQISTSAGAWGAISAIGGNLASPMACSALTSVAFDCYAVGWDFALWSKYIHAGKWAGWTKLGGLYKDGRPSVVRNTDRVDIFLLGTENQIMQKSWLNGWQPEVSLGGVFESSPECVMMMDSKILCVAIGPRSDLFKNTYDGFRWSGWVNLFGRYMTEAPSCVISDKQTISCYLRNVYNEIVEIDFEV